LIQGVGVSGLVMMYSLLSSEKYPYSKSTTEKLDYCVGVLTLVGFGLKSFRPFYVLGMLLPNI
jgi:hypothetical protein